MARYQVRYVTYAAEQLNQMPRSLRIAFDARIDDLERAPYIACSYDDGWGSYSTTFGETGIIHYVFSDENAKVTIIRVMWC